MHLLVDRSRTIFIADTTVNENPDAEDLAAIAQQTAEVARRMERSLDSVEKLWMRALVKLRQLLGDGP